MTLATDAVARVEMTILSDPMIAVQKECRQTGLVTRYWLQRVAIKPYEIYDIWSRSAPSVSIGSGITEWKEFGSLAEVQANLSRQAAQCRMIWPDLYDITIL